MDNVKRAEAYHKSRLGQILISRGYLSESELAQAVKHQASTGQKLGEVLLEQKMISRWQLRRALSNQTRLRFAASLAVALLSPLQLFASSEEEEGLSLSEPVAEQVYESQSHKLVVDDSDSVIQGTDQLTRMIMPLIEALPAGASFKTLSYDPNQARAEIRMNGTVRLRLPCSLGELRFDNIRLKGTAKHNADDLGIGDIDLSQASVSIRAIYNKQL